MRSTRPVQSSRPRPAVAPIVPGHGIDTAIGRTPVARLRRVVEPDMAEVWVKLEGADPCIRVRIGNGRDDQRGGPLPEGAPPRVTTALFTALETSP